MGAADWDIFTGGSGDFDHHEALHTATPFVDKLTDDYPSDTKCRRLDNPNATEFGRALFKYNREPTNFTLFKDVSVRGWIGSGARNAKSHVGLTCRMDTTLPTTLADSDRLFDNGYYTAWRQNGAINGWSATLDRYIDGVGTTLFNLDFPFAPGFYIWLWARMDFLWQSDGSAIVKLLSRALGDTEWTEQASIVETPGVIPPYDGIGWGAQIEGGGAEFINEAYVDLIEVYHG